MNVIKKFEEVLTKVPSEWRSIFDAINDPVCLLDPEGIILRCNKAMKTFLKKPYLEIIGRKCFELVHGISKPIKECPLAEMKKHLCRKMIEMPLGDRLFHVTVDPILDEKGKLNGAVHIMSDVTERKWTETSLRETNEYLDNLFNYTNAPIIVWDPQFRITRYNHAFESLAGKTASDIIGKPLKILFPPDLVESSMRLIRKTPAGYRLDGFEIPILRRDGTTRTVLWNSATIYNQDGKTPIATIAQGQDITIRKQSEEKLLRSREQLRELTRHLEAVREEEQQRLSRELHDELGQTLTALKIDVSWLKKRSATLRNEAVSEKIRAMSELIDQTIATTKRISTALRPAMLDDLGLVSAVEWQTDEFKKCSGINCALAVTPPKIVINPEIANAVFRILQEALTNILRYAEATRVKISLNATEEQIELKVKDNGKGISKEKIKDPQSLGLIGMRERLYPFGGALDIKGRKGKGTTVSIVIPLGQSDGEEKHGDKNSDR